MKKHSTSNGRREFHGRNLYKVSSDAMDLYCEGQPGQPRTGGTAPRITGLSYRGKETSLDLHIQDEVVNQGKASFKLVIQNDGRKPVPLKDINYVHPEGIKITKTYSNQKHIESGDTLTHDVSLEITGDFCEPVLSFTTILVSCYPRIEGLPHIPVTAGFERT